MPSPKAYHRLTQNWRPTAQNHTTSCSICSNETHSLTSYVPVSCSNTPSVLPTARCYACLRASVSHKKPHLALDTHNQSNKDSNKHSRRTGPVQKWASLTTAEIPCHGSDKTTFQFVVSRSATSSTSSRTATPRSISLSSTTRGGATMR